MVEMPKVDIIHNHTVYAYGVIMAMLLLMEVEILLQALELQSIAMVLVH